MRSSEIPCLHHIASVKDVAAIRKLGILSARQSEQRNLPREDIDSAGLREARAARAVGSGRAMPEYASLFLNARNWAMRRWIKRHGLDGVCVLRVHRDALAGSGVFVCSAHPGRSDSEILPAEKGLAPIQSSSMYYNSEPERLWMRAQPEVLIPDRVDPKFITGAFVATRAASAAIKSGQDSGDDFPVVKAPSLFGCWHTGQRINDEVLGALAGTPEQTLACETLARAAEDSDLEAAIEEFDRERRRRGQYGPQPPRETVRFQAGRLIAALEVAEAEAAAKGKARTRKKKAASPAKKPAVQQGQWTPRPGRGGGWMCPGCRTDLGPFAAASEAELRVEPQPDGEWIGEALLLLQGRPSVTVEVRPSYGQEWRNPEDAKTAMVDLLHGRPRARAFRVEEDLTAVKTWTAAMGTAWWNKARRDNAGRWPI